MLASEYHHCHSVFDPFSMQIEANPAGKFWGAIAVIFGSQVS